jgi:hypothetical protein
MCFIGLAVLAYLYWLWKVEPTLAPVLASLGIMAGLFMLQRPLTVQRVVLVDPERLTIATRLFVTITEQIALIRVAELREQQVGTKANPGWALQVVLNDTTTRTFGRLAPGFRPQLRAARTLIQSSRR